MTEKLHAPNATGPSDGGGQSKAMSIPDALGLGVQHQQAGRLREAESIYRRVLQVNPRQPDALHLLGLLAHRVGRYDGAIRNISQAVELRPDKPAYHNSLGLTLAAAGKTQEAEASYRRALDLDPKHPALHFNLGVACQNLSRPREAEAAYRQSIELKPDYAQALNNLGVVLQLQGRIREARDSYQQAVDLNDDYAEAQNNLGCAHELLGDSRQAAACFGKAVQLKPDYAKAHNNLGTALKSLGDLEGSAASYRRAVQINPRYGEAHTNLSSTLGELEQFEAAAGHARKAIEVDQDDAKAHNNLGSALKALDELEDAVASYRRALEVRPDYPDAHRNLGTVLTELDRYEEAAETLRRSLELEPDSAEAHNNLGIALGRLLHYPEAIEHYLRALELRPDQGPTHRNLAVAYADLGRFDQAAEHCHKAIALDGDDVVARELLTTFESDQVDDNEIARLQEALGRPQATDSQKATAHFGLGRFCDREGRFDEAFDHFAAANRLSGAEWNAGRHEQLISAMMGIYTKKFFKSDAGASGSERPIFIVGMPRSGTTLVEQIVSSHSQIFGAGELDDFRDFAQDLSRRADRTLDYPKFAAALKTKELKSFAETYLDRLRGFDADARHVIDKMHLNYMHLGLIARVFPVSRVIHCRRDPLDTCLSCYFLHTEALRYSADLDDLGRYYREYEQLMKHWHKVLPMPILDVQYEELVENQEQVSRKLVEFCGVEWDDRCLQFHENERAVKTASKWQVRQPMYATSIGRWKNYDKHLGPLRASLGLEAN